MLITLEPNDLWKEYVFWRNSGHPKVAFEYIRREQDVDYFEILMALIVKRRYGHNVIVGDMVELGDISFTWSQDM